MITVNFNSKKITPSKIVCIGRNYVEHIKELDNEIPSSMVIFMKPNSSISFELSTCKEEPIHYEGEISFLMESNKIAGVGFGLDLTKRGIQSKLKEKGLPWERAKAFDGATVFSDFVKFDDDVNSLHVKLFINDKLIQDGSVTHMLYKPKEMIQEIISFSTLEDGDIVMSGTPKGVGIVNSGDKFLGQIFFENTLLVEKKWIAK
ncbi:fumarylacetoacetate hydrolase family protein [Sulfurospirillum arcachonense]|uniref:fumarylacetoacetate hydrolase family protein n=1 Tax=Sulfurospirillum arcachonense TaxID=57666 RepID=UPI000469950F|nr:fumarylacetoacetate hydrolase family protein [Sulfurospirillum arcachonense]